MSTISAGTSATTALVATGDTTGQLVLQTNGTTTAVTIDTSQNVGINTTSPGSKLDVKGTLRLSGSTSGYVGLAPAAAAGSVTYTLPSADGSSGQFLKTDGAGTLSWTSSASAGSNISAGDSNVTVTDTGSNGTITFTTDGSERMRVTSAGNVGIGITPSAWSLTALQVSYAGLRGTAAAIGTSVNCYYDGAWKYISTGYASDNYQQDGDIVWRNTTSGTAGGTITWSERMRITAAGDVGIGTASPVEELHVYRGSATGTYLRVENTGGVFYAGVSASGSGYVSTESSDPLLFSTGGNERGQFTSDGYFCLGKTDTNNTTNGVWFSAQASASNFQSFFVTTRADGGAAPIYINRQSSDGSLIIFQQANTQEGDISVSGTTVSYNGGHLSRYAQTQTPKDDTLLKGTVLSNLDEMNVYTDAEGNPVPNEQLNKVKVSDVEGDVNVAGVFVNWSHDEQHNVDEINMAMTGDMIIRIAQGVVVQRGDLLMSAGDGTAKPQGDDIVRSKTVAKVTSNYVTCTYADGSYCVPCVLMAC